MELVTGATGYVGGRLIERLTAAGRAVRALAREPERLEPRAGIEVVGGDLVTGEGLDRALAGCETAYYLVHSMEAAAAAGRVNPAGHTPRSDFASRDRRAAERFAGAARRAGTERIVYLGGLMPSDDPPSRHLGSRLEVERTLLESVAGSTALRASILIGAGSSSFRVLVRLVERLRVMPFPEWRERRTQPIDERDAIEYLALTPERPEAAGRSLDIAGPDVVSYGEMIERIAEHMGIGRLPVGVPANATRAASAVVSALTDQPRELVRPLMESLQHDLLPRDDAAREIYGIRPRRFDRAVEHALRDWEAREELAAR